MTDQKFIELCGIFGAAFSQKRMAENSLEIEVNFLISQLPFFSLFWIFVDLSDPNCWCVSNFWHIACRPRTGRPGGGGRLADWSTPQKHFFNINLLLLNDCQILSPEMFFSENFSTYLKRNFEQWHFYPKNESNDFVRKKNIFGQTSIRLFLMRLIEAWSVSKQLHVLSVVHVNSQFR